VLFAGQDSPLGTRGEEQARSDQSAEKHAQEGGTPSAALGDGDRRQPEEEPSGEEAPLLVDLMCGPNAPIIRGFIMEDKGLTGPPLQLQMARLRRAWAAVRQHASNVEATKRKDDSVELDDLLEDGKLRDVWVVFWQRHRLRYPTDVMPCDQLVFSGWWKLFTRNNRGTRLFHEVLSEGEGISCVFVAIVW
jgi:hypothetical protein